jgi:hypothetical protein
VVILQKNVNDSRAGLDSHAPAILIELQNTVHAGHIEQHLPIIQDGVAIATPAAPWTNTQSVRATKIERITALLNINGVSHDTLRIGRANQHRHRFLLHEVGETHECLHCSLLTVARVPEHQRSIILFNGGF